QWIWTSPLLSPPFLWRLYLGLGFGLSLLAVAIHFVRVYRNPVVRAVAADTGSLLRLPLARLPYASRSLARARRLDGTLGMLGISNEQWQHALEVAQTPRSAVEHVAEVLGAQIGPALGEGAAYRAELPALRVRFGPHVGLAVVDGARVE